MGDSIDGNSASGTREGKTSIIGEGEPHAHSITVDAGGSHTHTGSRSEEHTSELQSLMRISYAVFCLIKIKLAQHINAQLHTNIFKLLTYTYYDIYHYNK